jgi:CBS-domain-containing membrane protein
MKKIFNRIDKEFKQHWKHYVFQSLFATITVFIVIWMLTLKNAVVIGAIGATAFIVFALPKSLLAKPQNIIGGYAVGFLCGLVCSLIPLPDFVDHNLIASLVYALAVGLSIFIMVTIDLEHPPASAIALAVAVDGFRWPVTLAILISVLTLSIIHIGFNKYLKDLA